MTKRVLSVGQCPPDHQALRGLIESNFDAHVLAADLPADTLEQLGRDQCDLVLINRKLDADYSDGIELLRRIKSDPDLAEVPVMLVTNDLQHQEAAIAAGAEPGFGKLQYTEPATLEKLRKILA